MNRLTDAQIAAQIRAMAAAMTEALHSTKVDAPTAKIGALAGVVGDKWEEGIEYAKGQLFTYNGNVGFVRQAHTSAAQWLPFTIGTESLYGARPVPDENGVYPYIYNMRSEVGMLVRSQKDGNTYRAKQISDPLLYDPADVPALFDKV